MPPILAWHALIVPSVVEGIAPVATPTPADRASTAAKARTGCIQKRFKGGPFRGIWRAYPGSCIQGGAHRSVAGGSPLRHPEGSMFEAFGLICLVWPRTEREETQMKSSLEIAQDAVLEPIEAI